MTNAEAEQDDDDAGRDEVLPAIEVIQDSFGDWQEDAYEHSHENSSSELSSAAIAHAPENAPLRFRFQRGAGAGIQLHHWFETLDWSTPAEQWPFNAEQRAWFDEVSNTALPSLSENLAPWSLRQVTPANTQREMNFLLPLQQAQLQRVAELATPYGYALPRFQQPPRHGFLKGSVDLVCWQQGRAYLLDYKSNWLGDTFADYAPAALEMAMREHGYHAQHLLYLTALHRWLSSAMPGYEYEEHIGGVVYLFVRGMSPQHPGCGVYATRPARELIEALSQLMSPDPLV
jgi:exodeoxyribonuclease V beta subunit